FLDDNAHSIQFTRFKCTTRWFLVCSEGVQPSPPSNFRMFHHPRMKPYIHYQPLLIPHHPPTMVSNHSSALSLWT
ncbi:hypothetical protein POVCU1_059300, partial [Plasmodium ovale curtisi]